MHDNHILVAMRLFIAAVVQALFFDTVARLQEQGRVSGWESV